MSDEYEIDGMVVGPAPTAAPSAPEPYDFEVRWANGDQPTSTYSNVTGSSYDGNRVMLFRADVTWVLNFDEIQAISIRKSDEF